MSLRKAAYLYSGSHSVSSRVTECKWTKEREQGGRRAERGRECMRERKDESNALQQRTVTDQAFIWAQTAAVAGRTQRQQQQHCFQSVPPPQLETRWTRRGGGAGDTHREHNTSPMPPAIWFPEYYVGFSSFALQHISSLFHLILFSPSLTLSSVLI